MQQAIKRLIPFYLLLVLYASCTSSESDVDNGSGNIPMEDILNPNYVHVDWHNTKMFEFNPKDGVYSFELTSETQKVKTGSVLVIDVDTMAYITMVKTVNEGDGKLTIRGEKGTLCDVFRNVTISLGSDGSVSTRSGGKRRISCFPERTLFQDEQGEWIPLNNTRNEEFTGNVWNYSTNLGTRILYSGANYNVYMPKIDFSASLDAHLKLSFGKETDAETMKEIISQHRSQALEMKAYLEGKVDFKLEIRAEAFGKAVIKEQEDELWIHNIFKPFRHVYIVEGIPIYVTLSGDLYRGASMEMDGEIVTYFGTGASLDGKLGLDWNQSDGMSPINMFEASVYSIPPTVEGEGTITGKAYLYPRIHLTLYEVVGPSFDFKTYLGSEVKGGFKAQMLDNSSNFSAWTLRNFMGLDVNAGTSLMFLNYETKREEIGSIHVFEKNLYQSPLSINYYDATSDKIKRGVKNTVRFSILDKDYILNKETPTPLPQIAKFEAKGLLSSQFGIAKNGIVKVDWTPDNSTDSLNAILYDKDGNILSMATFGPRENMDEEECAEGGTHPHAIDLGFGTKWACCNVGASSPYGVGTYFAWGETEGKDEYKESNYAFNIGERWQYIGDNISGTQYDAARAKWGDPWRMPTKWDLYQLINNCTYDLGEKNGTKGVEFTSKLNGNKIFFPITGLMYDSNLLYTDSGVYWMGTFDEDNYSGNPHRYEASTFRFNLSTNKGVFSSGEQRHEGLAIRPIQ